MSLVIPSDLEAARQGLELDPKVRENLRAPIQNLIDLGAIVVASAGNEGDLRYNPMNMMPTTRPEALYPAAFAYDDKVLRAERIIPVGAVNVKGNVTQYSCYPGVNGVATYGGDIPDPNTDLDHDANGMTRVNKIDGVIGIYTQLSYPALSIDDPESTYPVPNAHGWAYWVGTSFATPIVSAVVAKALELEARTPTSPSIAKPPTIVNGAATDQIMWDSLTPATTPVATRAHGGSSATEIAGAMIKAVQCKPSHSHRHHAHEDEQEVEVNVTEVNITEMPVLVVEDINTAY
jgi:subtilisin family serine protease